MFKKRKSRRRNGRRNGSSGVTYEEIMACLNAGLAPEVQRHIDEVLAPRIVARFVKMGFIDECGSACRQPEELANDNEPVSNDPDRKKPILFDILESAQRALGWLSEELAMTNVTQQYA